MESAELSRAGALVEWATCAPNWVRARLTVLLQRPQLLREDREKIEAMLTGLVLPPPPSWACRFPAVANGGGTRVPKGGILMVVAPEWDSKAFPGAVSAVDVMDLSCVPDASLLFLTGMPRGKLDGTSGSAAAWLAGWARQTGRKFPAHVVVSADLIPGPNGEPRLAAVAHGDEKAKVVAQELPDATLYLCGAHTPQPKVVSLEPGTPIRNLLTQILGRSAVVDRAEVVRVAGAADEAFKAHAYRLADTRYQGLLEIASEGDGDLRHDACLRLGQIAVHRGCPAEADAWLERAQSVILGEGKQGQSAVELLCSQAGAALDLFRPALARDFLTRRPADLAKHPDHHIVWERIQVLGAWRRVYLLEGHDEEARATQQLLLSIVGPRELPRTLLDLAWVEIRYGNLEAARECLLQVRGLIAGMEEVYRIQTRAFLAWYAGRLTLRGGKIDGLEDLLDLGALEGVAEVPQLQAAGKWRIDALRFARDGDIGALQRLAEKSEPFQRWHLGTFLLEWSELWSLGLQLLRGSDVELGGMPELEKARERLRRGEAVDEAVFRRLVAY